MTCGKRQSIIYAMVETPLTVFWCAYVIAYATAAPRLPETLSKSVRLALGMGLMFVGRSSHCIASALRLPSQRKILPIL